MESYKYTLPADATENSTCLKYCTRNIYRKLALQRHPDKNKSIGADSAFKLMSDKNWKMEYDQLRIVNGFQNQGSQPNGDHSVRSSAIGFCSFSHTTLMQYEYSRIFFNHNLLCPNCHQAFVAIELGIPGNAANSSISWLAKRCPQNLNHNYIAENCWFQRGPKGG
ncbi:unnamed protein product [Musa acuminata subsp. malaccensis]|uniref:(wild Malaysian banana) hypothetical protein n=1 Tax=Musa acuminata subsp. malaccensis TaxID=214687 RepID=A0A8D7APU7_MUSAM|nr:unnamed protein product [Musa acuminata subsp. malaccensis]